MYWNRLFLEDRQASEARPQRAASPYGSAGRRWDALGPVTVEGYVKMIRKLVKDAAEIFPRKKSIAAEWYMEFWGDPISLPRARKPARMAREFLEEEEVRALVRACKTRRETALVATLAYSGLRIGEKSPRIAFLRARPASCAGLSNA